MNDIFTPQFLALILAVILGLMGFVAKTVVQAKYKIGIMERDISGLIDVLPRILAKLETIAQHDSVLAVVNTELSNMKAKFAQHDTMLSMATNDISNIKAEIALIFEKFKEAPGGKRLISR